MANCCDPIVNVWVPENVTRSLTGELTAHVGFLKRKTLLPGVELLLRKRVLRFLSLLFLLRLGVRKVFHEMVRV